MSCFHHLLDIQFSFLNIIIIMTHKLMAFFTTIFFPLYTILSDNIYVTYRVFSKGIIHRCNEFALFHHEDTDFIGEMKEFLIKQNVIRVRVNQFEIIRHPFYENEAFYSLTTKILTETILVPLSSIVNRAVECPYENENFRLFTNLYDLEEKRT